MPATRMKNAVRSTKVHNELIHTLPPKAQVALVLVWIYTGNSIDHSGLHLEEWPQLTGPRPHFESKRAESITDS